MLRSFPALILIMRAMDPDAFFDRSEYALDVGDPANVYATEIRKPVRYSTILMNGILLPLVLITKKTLIKICF